MRFKHLKCFDINRNERGEWDVDDRSYHEMLNAGYPVLFHNKDTNELFGVYVPTDENGKLIRPVMDVESEEIVDDECCLANSFISDTLDNDSALDEQVGGTHYKDVAIQPVEYIERNHLGFCAGNIVKYVTRHKQKGGKEDLLKARYYIDLLIELEYGND